MAGFAIVMDLLRKNPAVNAPPSFHSYGAFSAAAAAAGTPFAFRAFLGYVLMRQWFRCSCLEFDFFVIEMIGLIFFFKIHFYLLVVSLNWIRLLRFVVLMKR